MPPRALSKLGRADEVLKDLREIWSVMPSVLLNNALQEDWAVRSDSASHWSHCALAPLFALFVDIAVNRPTTADFTQCQIRAQLGGLEHLNLTACTVQSAPPSSSPLLPSEKATRSACHHSDALVKSWLRPFPPLSCMN